MRWGTGSVHLCSFGEEASVIGGAVLKNVDLTSTATTVGGGSAEVVWPDNERQKLIFMAVDGMWYVERIAFVCACVGGCTIL